MSLAEKKAQEKNVQSYKETLNLPTTTLAMRANMGEREPALRAYWDEQSLATSFFAADGEAFVLHDGPPYANGHLHMGHALNNVLKDAVVRSQRMLGKAVQFVPGWDCHGLPIELKVVQEQGAALAQDPASFKTACRRYAQQWKEVQEGELKALGVLAEWNKAYMTMDPGYEASILRSLATFTEEGFIERKGKTVPWCSSCQTVLAAAEIEYAERKDPSCYVKFKALADPKMALLIGSRTVSFVIWTTTPWTLPLNRAVALNPDALYCVVLIDEYEAVIISSHWAERLGELFGPDARSSSLISGSTFVGMRVHNPVDPSIVVPVVTDVGVIPTEGTGCLHVAPGCGPEDYLMGIKNNLEIYSPVSASGCYTEAVVPKTLVGMPVSEGQWWVLKKLEENARLVAKTTIKHSYPHCWRCRNGLIFRATDQWFCNLNHDDLVERAQASLEEITFVPSWGKNRLKAFLEHRTEWCISRQRIWGVPIPALYNTKNGQVFLDPKFIRAVAEKVAIEGIEYWDRVSIAELREQGMLPAHLSAVPDDALRKEKDILDVWFDSGVSHTAVIAARGGALPVDLYLEGSDQHRGWFQSSLLTAMALHHKPQTKAILTHGFVVDEHGHKMSKSRGNVIDPQDIVKKYGADVVRLWVASVDYERDVALSEALLTQTAEVYRKIRNTCRFLLANLYDFNPATDTVPFEDMLLLDRYALQQVRTLLEEVKNDYVQYRFALIVQRLTRYCTVELSAYYLDMSKDRLYVEQAQGLKRRSAQTAQYYILHLLTQMIAPLLPYTAEDIFQALPANVGKPSVHLTRFTTLPVIADGGAELWEQLITLREQVLKEIEKLRAAGTIKQSLEAQVGIRGLAQSSYAGLEALLAAALGRQTVHSFLKEWCIVSAITLQAADTFEILVTPAAGSKCPRCWHWFTTEHAEPSVCGRCENVMKREADD